MTKPDLPVEAHLLAALKREMQRRPDEAVQQAVAARLSVTLGANVGSLDLSGVEPATGALGGATGAASAAATGISWVQPLVVLMASATLSTGALFAIRTLDEPAPGRAAPLASHAAVPAPLPPAAAPPPLRPLAPATEPASELAVPSASAPRPAANSSASAAAQLGPSLREQQALLDTARRALAKHDGAAALEALAWHRARFPKTALEEEREALTVKALREAGRAAEASERARRFSKDYPRSVFLPGVDPGPGSIP